MHLHLLDERIGIDHAVTLDIKFCKYSVRLHSRTYSKCQWQRIVTAHSEDLLFS